MTRLTVEWSRSLARMAYGSGSEGVEGHQNKHIFKQVGMYNTIKLSREV